MDVAINITSQYKYCNRLKTSPQNYWSYSKFIKNIRVNVKSFRNENNNYRVSGIEKDIENYN